MLLLAGLMVVATGGGDGYVDVTVIGISGAVAGIVTAAVAGAVDVAASIASTTAVVVTGTAAGALAFSVPVAMHLRRYGRLPS